jgi:hypothetical protein
MEEKNTQKKVNSGPPYGEPNTTSLIVNLMLITMLALLYTGIYLLVKNIG